MWQVSCVHIYPFPVFYGNLQFHRLQNFLFVLSKLFLCTHSEAILLVIKFLWLSAFDGLLLSICDLNVQIQKQGMDTQTPFKVLSFLTVLMDDNNSNCFEIVFVVSKISIIQSKNLDIRKTLHGINNTDTPQNYA